MARPRVFISSTYYDLKHIRASLENFVESLGFDPILSEKGSIPYDPTLALDKSCYREVGNADIFVLIIGGRYGSEKSDTKSDKKKGFYEQYDSITKVEYQEAVERDVPIYILIERPVYAEYETYLANKANKKIKYVHVQSVNVFALIEEILGKRRNNPVQQFDRHSEIQEWLREQWAGLFRDLLRRQTSQQQLTSLSQQVAELASQNKTLRDYLEKVVTKVAPNELAGLKKDEEERSKRADQERIILANSFAEFLVRMHGLTESDVLHLLTGPATTTGLLNVLRLRSPSRNWRQFLLSNEPYVVKDINKTRKLLGLPPMTADLNASPNDATTMTPPPETKPDTA